MGRATRVICGQGRGARRTRLSLAAVRLTRGPASFRSFDLQSFVTVLAAFGFGYAAALLIHRHIR
jgi:hypothetical protein